MIRFNPDTSASMIGLLSLSKKNEDTALQQLATGRRVNVPSDDPSAEAANIEDLARINADDQYVANTETIRELMSTADSTLNSVITSLQRAISIGVEGSNDTNSADNRAAIASDVLGIRDQILSLANLSFRGRFVFGGTENGTTPYVKDANSSSGVMYVGNTTSNQVQVGEACSVAVNSPGTTVFGASGNDVFTALQSLADSLSSNSAGDVIGQAVIAVRSSLDHISQSRVFYGNTMNQMDAESSFLANDKLLVQQHQNNNVGVDPTKAASDLSQAQFVRQSTMQAVALVGNMSLLDYLRQ